MVQRRGTLVAAICEADPSGDWLAGALALDAAVEIVGPSGRREMPVSAFVRSARHPGEIVGAVRLPVGRPPDRTCCEKAKHAAIGWSVASAAVTVWSTPTGTCERIRIVASGAFDYPQRLTALEKALVSGSPRDDRDLRSAVERGLAGFSFQGDHYASADWRAKRLAILLERVLGRLLRSDAAPS